YFFRTEGGTLADWDAMSLRSFAWYVTPWVLAVSVVAIALVTWTGFWRSPAFFLTFAIFSLFFFYKMRIVPAHFWAERSFLAVSVPGMLLMLTAGTALISQEVLGRLGLRDRWRDMAGTVLMAASLAPVGWTFWTQAAPVRQHIEYAGLIPKLEQMAANI